MPRRCNSCTRSELARPQVSNHATVSDFVRYFGAIEGERLSTAPQGYSRDHPEIDLLRLKQVLVVHHFTDKQILAQTFRGQAVKVMKAMTPFNDYLNRVLS